MLAQDISSAQQLLQVIVTLLGVMSQILLLMKGFRDKPSTQVTQNEDAPSPHTASVIKTSPRSLIDLSFVLICAAFFSLLLTDSLVISGRTPAPEISSILIVLSITLVVVGTMLGAWFLRQAELITGFLAITTLLVLVISPGGPFFSSSSDGETGLSLLIPLVSLVILSSGMLVYSFGSPLSKSGGRRRRLTVTLGLGLIVLVAAGALGRQLIANVTSNRLTPKIDSASVKEILPEIMNAELNDKRNFYQLASEISLLRTYQNYFRTIRGEKPAAPKTDSNSEAVGQNGQAKQPANQAKQPADSKEKSSRPNPAPTNQPTDSDRYSPENLTATRALELLIQKARTDGDWESVTNFQSFSRRSNSIATDYLAEHLNQKDHGRARPNLLMNYFKAIPVADQQEYLSQRLGWIHPVGLPSQSQAGIPLPGITNEERFEAVSSMRIIQVLDDQENLRTKLFAEFDKEFDYQRSVRNAFKQQEDYYYGPDEPTFRPTRQRTLFKPVLFPKMEPNPNSARLTEQLALPFQMEAYVAYSEYKQLALSLIKRTFRDKIGETESDRITNAFDELGDQTQEAFLTYVVYNRESPQSVYQMLCDFHAHHVDFTALTNSKDPLVVDTLESLIDRGSLPNQEPALIKLASDVNSLPSAESKHVFRELLRSEVNKTPIKSLFEQKVFDLVDDINRNLTDQRKEFFDAVADPIWLVAKEKARLDAVDKGTKFPTVQLLDKFRALPESDQNGLLHYLAVSLYQPGGDNSLDPIRLLVAQAKAHTKVAALLTASLITLPVLLVSIFLGGLFARKLVARDRMRELVQKEALGYPEEDNTFGSPVDLFGRTELLNALRGLTERGWSTIGVVGRRGVGKSRLLHALLESGFQENARPSVKVWVSSPSKFHEEDFISSMLERLAFNTENAIAAYLKVKPISIRRIESRAAQVGTWLYVGAVIVLSGLIYEMASRLTRADIVITWIPILAIVFTSVGVFLNYMSKLQPVDLSSWLQRDRTHNPHTVMLYREVYEVLTYLRGRTHIPRADRVWLKGGFARWGLLAFLGLVFLYSGSMSISILSESSSTRFALPFLLLSIISLASWIYMYFYRSAGGQLANTYGQSLMSLIAEYRAFASTIVYRLGQGALGHTSKQKFSVLICIDELDKIVDFEDIRTFVRRIKAIFEVPGVYYYVSLAEDTLTALYLGPAEGKNEIDSSFDHIVRIPPVSCEVGETIATTYLNSHNSTQQPKRLARTIATLSFGVPRDIIRRCDEFIANKTLTQTPEQLSSGIRKTQASMGYELKQITRRQMIDVTTDAWNSSLNSARIFGDNLEGESAQRLVLSLWVLALIETALTLPDDDQWHDVTKDLCAIGYRLPIDQLSDLECETRRIHDVIADRTQFTNPDLIGTPKPVVAVRA